MLHKGLSLPLHPNPPLIGRNHFSTKIKLAQGRGRGEGYLQREGGEEGGKREGGREGYLHNIYIYV